jgi:hypothetical protein
MDHELEKELAVFFQSFEEVFHRDWSYTKAMLGIHAPTEEDRKKLMSIFDESDLESAIFGSIAPNGTFLNPGLDDPGEDWAHRGRLLDSYHRLLPILKKHGIVPTTSSKDDEKASYEGSSVKY